MLIIPTTTTTYQQSALGALPSRVLWGILQLWNTFFLLYITRSAIKVSHDELRSWDDIRSSEQIVAQHHRCIKIYLERDDIPSLLFPVLNPVLAPRLQLIYSVIHMLSPLLIYTIEGYRIGRHGTVLSLPFIFMIGMQVQGISKISPLYALLSAFHSEQNPVDRAVRIDLARSLIPALVLSVIASTTLPIAPNAQSELLARLDPSLTTIYLAALTAISERQIIFSPYSRSSRLVAMTTLGG